MTSSKWVKHMADLQDLYRQIILDHARNPQGRGLIGSLQDGGVAQSHQVNPTCGDEITLRAHVMRDRSGDVRILDVSWEGQGCSISQASSSVMTELVIGQTLTQVEDLAAAFRSLMDTRGGTVDPQVEEQLGDAAAFAGVSKFPARVKCALLAWIALRDALLKATPVEGERHG
ncbi:nitrogen fixation protein NifU [Micrococcales bacterium KH10]|nr:nitrogen fixation protein NifU [Micrococcales bacterium KH10]